MLCFPAPRDYSGKSGLDDWHDSILSSFMAAANQLTTAFPWLAGRVIDDSGVFRVVAYEPSSIFPNSIIRFKDCRSIAPPYDEIVSARGPIRLLDGKVLAPRTAFPESYQESDEEPAPVLVFQVNLVEGGILVDCAAQHNIIDMTGIEQCFVLLATAMRGEAFPLHAIEQGNRDRRSIVPLLRDGKPRLDHSQFKRTVSSERPDPTVLGQGSGYFWRYYRFSRSQLAQLKEQAQEGFGGLPPDSQVPYISTNDALSAFCWKRIGTVRLRRGGATTATTKFCRAVNARPAMGVPREYMGDLVIIATSRFALGELAQAPLAVVTAALRKDLQVSNNEYYIRSFATLIANEPDRSIISYGGNFNPETDIGSSSWADVQLYRVEFGPLGKPALVRRPNFAPLKSDIYFMPRTEAGDIDALLCMTEEDFVGLDKDPEWKLYSQYIG
ncbi:putative trichothecene biosynthesis acetyltransferase [Aspergillus clavatus NRRL 1]|uniref:Trichothecene biosynthesis acetyltransferase, putative n=1 Tax=Aspergillus clavatus (strain ATCC 1007 / CBS 513.65 / DSM 816 / NCTC 3887 / NRRL 1 / QM 1276 / 107) TaxID=344612 RepID=A1CUU1_ASPCL|nr:trichothecene biosynthesis acetyltransferase, putative [Aspergillus clavatus NRRL 1]EAW07078.1 trichothecene biosynthesis acetyltransferase, putative [Aspergillus clavatus NRRL 1]